MASHAAAYRRQTHMAQHGIVLDSEDAMSLFTGRVISRLAVSQTLAGS